MSPYPKSELFFIRNTFSRHWRNVLDNKAPPWYKNGDIASVKYVNSLHQNHPPHIRMYNAEPYPFLEVDAKFTPPLHYFMSSSSISEADQPPCASELEASEVDQPDMQGRSEMKCDDRKRWLELSSPSPPPSPAKSKRVHSKQEMIVSTSTNAAGKVSHNGERNNANFRPANDRRLWHSHRHVNRRGGRE